jgi:hypothetical protein
VRNGCGTQVEADPKSLLDVKYSPHQIRCLSTTETIANVWKRLAITTSKSFDSYTAVGQVEHQNIHTCTPAWGQKDVTLTASKSKYM